MSLGLAGMSRREFLAAVVAAGGASALSTLAGPVIDRAYATDPAGTGSLADIEHFVLLMQENRSFDHYFGTLSGVRGFDESSPAFRQLGYNPLTHKASSSAYLEPFRLDTTHGATLDGECINDPTHSWGPQHQCWNGGAMDQWVKVHLANEGVGNGPATMGYYTRADIPVHFALADAFTVCDHYFCSVLGPTDPNRLYWISGTIDPDGAHGGPLLETPTLVPKNKYSWQTYPEALQEAGVSWKVYTSKDIPVVSEAVLSGMLQSFKSFQDPHSELYKRGVQPTFPGAFATDVKNNTLPAVSWIIPSLLTCEHPALPPAFGAQGIVQVLNILTSNPAVWEKTALIVSYDENGGFFDHVPPPTPPPGTAGEYVTVPLGGVAESMGIAGPIGLGFRVPGLVISPYTRGGLVASEVFDHTSQLRLLETRFGVPVPNLSAWRRSTVGDMTSAFNFAASPNSAKPRLPATGPAATKALAECKVGIDTLLGTFDSKNNPFSYPVPPNKMPTQERTPLRGQPSGPLSGATTAAAFTAPSTDGESLPVVTGGKPRSRVAATVDAAVAAHHGQ
ncbi:MAG TPA: phospholipase C [Jatrophihabitans sp.]|nr:phospholipase C [Jatrophihabitans sp.]